MKELDGFDALCERQFPINWMFACDGKSISANSSERHVRPKWPLIILTVGLKERCAQCREFISDRTLRPQQTGSSRLRTVTDMLECQRDGAQPGGHKAKLLDCFGYGSLLPRRHEREVDIGSRDEPNSKFFETYGKPGKLACDLWRDLQAHKDADRTAVGRWRSKRRGVAICHR